MHRIAERIFDNHYNVLLAVGSLTVQNLKLILQFTVFFANSIPTYER
jgi:hypothetical protein